MRLPVKITLLVFAVILLFIALISLFLAHQMDSDFRARAEKQMQQGLRVLQLQLEFLTGDLQSSMSQLTSTVFNEDESVLAGLLSVPPDLNPGAIAFADKLRRRTSLHFLDIINSGGLVVSTSPDEAEFGKRDALPNLPFERPVYVYDGVVRIELKRQAVFGNRRIVLRGGYFLREELEKTHLPGIRIAIDELDPYHPHETPEVPPFDNTYRTHILLLQDFLARPVMRIVVATPTDELVQQRSELVQSSLEFAALALPVCILFGFLVSLWLSRPLYRLRDAALQMASGDLSTRVSEGASGEVGELVGAFNNMAEQLDQKQKKLLQAERLAAWQDIARHLAHEIKNPLAPIRTSIANLRLSMEKAPEKFREIFAESSDSIVEEVEKLRRLADEFARFARLPAPQKAPGDLNETIRRCLLLYESTPGSSIVFEPGKVPVLAFDADQMTEVIHNLVRNSLQAGATEIRVSTGVKPEAESEVVLSVADNGEGMDEATLRQVFAPYFTTRTAGTGLGMAIVQRIITEHGGRIAVDSQRGAGTRFLILLPANPS